MPERRILRYRETGGIGKPADTDLEEMAATVSPYRDTLHCIMAVAAKVSRIPHMRRRIGEVEDAHERVALAGASVIALMATQGNPSSMLPASTMPFFLRPDE